MPEPEDIFASLEEKKLAETSIVKPSSSKEKTPFLPKKGKLIFILILVIVVLGGIVSLIFIQPKKTIEKKEKESVVKETVIDSDGDGLSDQEEESLKTDSNNPDTDADGLFDGEEVKIYKTDPLKADSNDNGLNDREETLQSLDIRKEIEKLKRK